VDDSQVWILKLGEKEKELVENPLYKLTNKLQGEELMSVTRKKWGSLLSSMIKSASSAVGLVLAAMVTPKTA
jgi:hypothetical protein